MKINLLNNILLCIVVITCLLITSINIINNLNHPKYSTWGVNCYNTIKVTFANKSPTNKETHSYVDAKPPKRIYTDIFFTGNKTDDNIKLAFSKLKIKEIIQTNNVNEGIHFTFSNECTYGTFLQLLVNLRNEKATRYIPVDNELWFFFLKPDTIKIKGSLPIYLY